MESKGLLRAIGRSIWVTLAGALALWWLWDGVHALGLLLGGVWSATNIWAMKELVEEICSARRPWKVALFAQLKLPVLYGFGACVLWMVPISMGAGIAGFQIPFGMIIMESIVHGSRETRSAGIV